MENKTNLYIFYGEDDFSIKRKIELWKTEFSKKYGNNAVVLIDSENVSETDLIKQLQESITPSLFSTKKLIIAKDVLPKKAEQKNLGEIILKLVGSIPKDFFLVFWQSKGLDRRLSVTKQLLKSEIKALEFNLPHGRELNAWIKQQATSLGSSIDDAAAEKLAIFLGRDLFEEKKIAGRVIERKEVFNLWQTYHELLKLSSFATRITEENVVSMVKPKLTESVFIFCDEIIKKNTKVAMKIFENILSSSSADEKLSIIKIIALLAEQIRSLIIVGTLQKTGVAATDIAEKLGWSSGRVFVISKYAKNADIAKMASLLTALVEIDAAIKSTDRSPKLLLNLFIAQATA